MGKRRSWFSAIKRVFTPRTKENLGNESDNKSTKEKKKKGIGRLRHGERNSFIPLFREPSSVEKILGEAEREHQLVFRPPSPPFVSPALRPASPRALSQRIASPETISPPARDPSPRVASAARVPSPKAASPPGRVRSSRTASPPARVHASRAAPAPAQVPSPRAASPPGRVRSSRTASPPAQVHASRAAPAPAQVPSPRAASPPGQARSSRAASPPARVHSSRAASPLPRAASSSPRPLSPRTIRHYLPEPTLPIHHASATKIQAAFRGYMARRSFRALKGLVRLQGVIRGQNVKRQTASAMKYMQLSVRVQSQIQSRRIQMLENQARQAQNQSDKEAESTLSKWTFGQSEAGNFDNWDDSLLTKEEVEARMQKKAEAAIKRERAMAYAYSHQVSRANLKSPQTMVSDIRSGGFPWWWSWLERQLHSENRGTKNIQLTPSRPASERKASPKPPSSGRQHHLGFDNIDCSTPKSSRSSIIPPAKPARTLLSNRTAEAGTSSLSKYSRPRASGADSPFNFSLKDDDSLTSCPPFSARNYMAPTVSARAKVRASSNPKERFPGTPGSESSRRRLSFPFSQGMGSFSWNKGSLSSSNKDPSSKKMLDRHQSLQSIGNLSINSTASMPATVARKPFNRFA